MEQFAYLFGGLVLLVILMLLVACRHDIGSKAIKVGLLGGGINILGELFAYRDYWQPPAPFGPYTVPVEDMLFGFALTGLSVTTYLVLSKRTFGPRQYSSRHRLYGVFFLGGITSMVVGSLVLGFNSVVIGSVVLLMLTVVMLSLRHDLWKIAVYTTAVLLCCIVVLYVLLFDYLAPHFWSSYWLLANTNLGMLILGNVPVTELLWYISWISFASISYPFVSGRTMLYRSAHTAAGVGAGKLHRGIPHLRCARSY